MEILEKVYIIQPKTAPNYKVLHEEAISLIESAGAAYCGTVYQTVKKVNPATYVGSGKLERLRQTLSGLDDITILFNGDLSPSQTLNISAALDDRKVIDRTTLILDIFASRAVSSEGKIQVELAQLKYIYPRLKGKGAALSRTGGGIGTRGPGETQLETDRRHIRARIKYLEQRLDETERRRAQTTARRQKDGVRTIALVGYTNTGKSTLMNTLTGAGVFAKDELFATLDPTARKFTIDGMDFLLVDTVGFLQDLPHDLIDAFKSTLESALNCDLALIVCDATADWEMQFNTTWNTLSELGFNGRYLKVLNKCEDITDFTCYDRDCVFISAKFGSGLDELKERIIAAFGEDFTECELFIPFKGFSEYAALSQYISEHKRSYTGEGMNVRATVAKEAMFKLSKFIKKA